MLYLQNISFTIFQLLKIDEYYHECQNHAQNLKLLTEW
jgi:hypothetical protein